MKKTALMGMVLLIAIGVSAVFAQTQTDGTFNYVEVKGGYSVSGIKGKAKGAIKIPAKFNNKPVVEITTDGFNNYGISELTIPDSVKIIRSNAFSYNSFSKLTIPPSVIEIGQGAFAYCRNLLSIDMVKSNVEIIGPEAFAGCGKLTKFEGGNSGGRVKIFGSGAFRGCNSLEAIWFRASVETIEDRAFAGCTALKRVNFQSPNTKIAATAFPAGAKLLEKYPNGGTGPYDAVRKNGSIADWEKGKS